MLTLPPVLRFRRNRQATSNPPQMADTTTADLAAPGSPPRPPPRVTPPPERRGRGQARVAWFSARAHNALRRPGRMGIVAGVVFAAALLTLILVPRQAQRAFAALMPRPDEWRDTTAARLEVARASAELATSRRAFLAAREEATAPPEQPEVQRVVLTPDQLRARDSLRAMVAVLQRELARVERSPLPASYRQLGELPELATEPRVRPLLDSLAAVERERDEFAALGGVDPIYVSLTTRVNAIGRAIQGLASRRVTEAAAALQAMEPPPVPVAAVVERPPVDTMGPLQRVVDAERARAAAERLLDSQRRANSALAERAEEARAGANFIAPPAAVLGAALVVALVAGYLWVLVGELRVPLVADAAEVERETGHRTLAVVSSEGGPTERNRRRADERSPDVLEPLVDAYRLLHMHISPTGASLPVVTITGDEPAGVARVSANLAAAAAAEARGVLLMDADLESGELAAALRVRPTPGLAELLRGDADWTDVVTSSIFGREQVVDVIPAGGRTRGRVPPPDDAFRHDLQRIARRYDLTVVSAPLAHACLGATSLLPAPDVILCVHAAVTRISDLRAAVAALHGAGLRLQGMVLMDGDS